MDVPEEHRESLWILIAGPIVWATHFLASYGTAALWCARLGRDGGVGVAGLRLIVAGYTVAALAALGVLGWRALHAHRYGESSLPHDNPSAADRHRFMGFATLLLAGLSAAAIVFQALPAVFIGSCR